MNPITQDSPVVNKGYFQINGLSMYYERYGSGKPLVLIHGGGSTIQTSFGHLIPELARHRQVIAMELQAHGRTNDRPTALSFEQDADDVATLCQTMGIHKADFLGFSNGGHTAFELALRHPGLLNKLIIASAFYKRTAAPPPFWEGFEGATLDQMPQVLKQAYLQVTHQNEQGLLTMFQKDVQRMKAFKDWTDEQMQSINAPVLVMSATQDVGRIEHAVQLYRLFPDGELAIFPGGHGTYLGAQEGLSNGHWPAFNAAGLIREFLET